MIKIINPTPTEKTNRLETIEERAGIYLLYTKDRHLLYIGQSENVWDRIRQQLPSFPKAHYFAACYIEDPMQRAIYEISMINELQPIENKEYAFYKK